MTDRPTNGRTDRVIGKLHIQKYDKYTGNGIRILPLLCTTSGVRDLEVHIAPQPDLFPYFPS